MSPELLNTVIENASSQVFLAVFVYYFLNKFSATQEKIVETLMKITESIVRLEWRVDKK